MIPPEELLLHCTVTKTGKGAALLCITKYLTLKITSRRLPVADPPGGRPSPCSDAFLPLPRSFSALRSPGPFSVPPSSPAPTAPATLSAGPGHPPGELLQNKLPRKGR